MESSQENNIIEGGNKGSGGFLCRQSSTRWTPTTEQIRILKDLYYNNGVRSPSAEQIQRISARLRQYGKIEGKNVFYWFQNHKARERQKKRFTTDLPNNNSTTIMQPRSSSFLNHSLVTNPPPGSAPPGLGLAGASCPSSSSGGAVFNMQQGGSYGYGSHHHVNMNMVDKSFIRVQESSLVSGGGGQLGFGMVGHHHHYQGDPYSSSSCANLLDKRRFWMEEETNNNVGEDEDDEDDDDDDPEIETLPLFPMHAEDIKMNMNMNYYTGTGGSGWYRSSDNGGSLELSLNSYSYYNH